MATQNQTPEVSQPVHLVETCQYAGSSQRHVRPACNIMVGLARLAMTDERAKVTCAVCVAIIGRDHWEVAGG